MRTPGLTARYIWDETVFFDSCESLLLIAVTCSSSFFSGANVFNAADIFLIYGCRPAGCIPGRGPTAFSGTPSVNPRSHSTVRARMRHRQTLMAQKNTFSV